MSKMFRDRLVLKAGENPATYIVVEEGTGDNLLREDRRCGFVDYVNWDSYIPVIIDGEETLEPLDGGMVLLTDYTCNTAERDIIDMVMLESGAPFPVRRLGKEAEHERLFEDLF